jgi:lipopolysaccharide export system protein LptA
MKISRLMVFLNVFPCLIAAPVFAQTATGGLQKNQPIEISSDKLDVYQEDHKAIFTGNVIAVQGTSNLRSATMVVYYRDSSTGKDAKKAAKAAAPTPAPAPVAPATPAADAPAQGIYRIDATTNVVFTTPTETATGDVGVYDVDADTIDLTGKNVVLTQGQNVLKGTHVIHNMTTGRSVMTNTDGSATDVTNKLPWAAKPAGRVHGLFVPKADDGAQAPAIPPVAGGAMSKPNGQKPKPAPVTPPAPAAQKAGEQ